MAGEGLYERYKDALKKGHVAALKGRLDEALDAYAEASRIAPERSTPHTAAGTALLRRKRPADALAYYEAAVRLAPRDEAALLGRAQALVALDRKADAADAYDALVEVRTRSGKVGDAVDAARRALELAEGRERRRTLERLIGRLRGSGIDAAGRAALDRALRVLEGPKVAPPVRTLTPAEAAAMAAAVEAMDAPTPAAPPAAAAAAIPWPAAELGGAVVDVPEETGRVEWPAADLKVGAGADGTVGAPDPTVVVPEMEGAPEAQVVPEAETEADRDAVVAEAAELDETATTPPAATDAAPADEEPMAGQAAPGEEDLLAEVDPRLEAMLASVDEEEPSEAPDLAPLASAIPAALERDLPPGIELDGLARLAEAALDAGDTEHAIDRLLDLAAANRLYGTQDAAVDACYQGLSLAPDHVGLHLALVQLYDERGWGALATEKLDLLERLTALDEDPGAAQRVEAAKAARG